MNEQNLRVGDTIRVYGTVDGGIVRNPMGRVIVKSFTMRVISAAQGTIEGTELCRNGDPRMSGGSMVYRSIVAGPFPTGDTYEITESHIDEVTVTERLSESGVMLYAATCSHGHSTGLYVSQDDATAVARGHGMVLIPTYVQAQIMADAVASVEPAIVAEVAKVLAKGSAPADIRGCEVRGFFWPALVAAESAGFLVEHNGYFVPTDKAAAVIRDAVQPVETAECALCAASGVPQCTGNCVWSHLSDPASTPEAKARIAADFPDAAASFYAMSGQTPVETAEQTQAIVSAFADLFQRARFLGYTDESAARVADSRVNYGIPSGEECETHPGLMVIGGDCEACVVITMSNDEGYTLEKWREILASRAAQDAAEEAFTRHMTATFSEGVAPLDVYDTSEYRASIAALVAAIEAAYPDVSGDRVRWALAENFQSVEWGVESVRAEMAHEAAAVDSAREAGEAAAYALRADTDVPVPVDPMTVDEFLVDLFGEVGERTSYAMFDVDQEGVHELTFNIAAGRVTQAYWLNGVLQYDEEYPAEGRRMRESMNALLAEGFTAGPYPYPFPVFTADELAGIQARNTGPARFTASRGKRKSTANARRRITASRKRRR